MQSETSSPQRKHVQVPPLYKIYAHFSALIASSLQEKLVTWEKNREGIPLDSVLTPLSIS